MEECIKKNRFVEEVEIDEICVSLSATHAPYTPGQDITQTITINDYLEVDENVFATKEEAEAKLREVNA